MRPSPGVAFDISDNSVNFPGTNTSLPCHALIFGEAKPLMDITGTSYEQLAPPMHNFYDRRACIRFPRDNIVNDQDICYDGRLPAPMVVRAGQTPCVKFELPRSDNTKPYTSGRAMKLPELTTQAYGVLPSYRLWCWETAWSPRSELDAEPRPTLARYKGRIGCWGLFLVTVAYAASS